MSPRNLEIPGIGEWEITLTQRGYVSHSKVEIQPIRERESNDS